ncbi:MAG: TonB-dependent receptor [Bacteroidota bacterium]|jgi:hypothetical protein
MKNKLFHISRTHILYFFIGLTVQFSYLNILLALPSLEDKKLEDVKIKMSGGDISLEQAFQFIEQQTDFKFFYIKEEVPLDKKIEINQQEGSLYQILQGFAKEFGLAFSRINNQIVVKKTAVVQSETYKVSGIVRDGSTYEPLVFANILIEGTQQGTTTDAEGRFSFVLTQGQYTLRCSFVGYRTELLSITVLKDVQLSIAMVSMDVLMQDVTVYAHRMEETEQPEVSALSLQSESIKHVTSIFSDVMRSVQMLPGVSTDNEFSSKFNVRGGNQDENLVLVNGTQVYDPYHVKEASNASIGIFNVDMVKKMDLVTGGFTARYGDKMSSVLNIEYREGSREQYKGIASISLMDLNAMVEGPLGDKGSFIIGGRKSYLEYVMKMMGAGPYIHPSFYDIQGVFAYSLNPRQKLLLKFIHAGDDFSEDPHRDYQTPSQWIGYDNTGLQFTNTRQSNDSVDNHANYYSSMVALQSINILSSSALLKTEISFYDQREIEDYWYESLYSYRGVNPRKTYFYNNTYENAYNNNLRIRTLELNSTLDMQITSLYGIKAGAGYQRINYNLDLFDQQTIEEFTNEYKYPDTTLNRRVENPTDYVNDQINTQSYKFMGYLENIIQISNQILLNVGGRFDYFDLNKQLTLSPRINLAYQTGIGIVVRGAWGHYYQTPIYRQIAYPSASDTNTKAQRAIHYIVGVDYDLMIDQAKQHFWRFKVEGYKKIYDNLITATQTSYSLIYYSRKNDATGAASGMDMQVIYSNTGFYGWISYGYLFSRQTLIHDTIGSSFPRYTDQRHTLAVTGEVGLGSGWSINSRMVYGSGYPYTPSIAVFNNSKRIWEWIPSNKPNSEYLPSYSRVDLRVAKDFTIFGAPTSVFLDVSNIFNATNIQAYRYRFDNNGNPYREEVKLWPIIPSLGMAVQF